MTGSIKPLTTLHVMDMGTFWRLNFRKTSPMAGTSDPFMAVPHVFLGVKNFLRYGLFTKYSYDIHDPVQPESPKTALFL